MRRDTQLSLILSTLTALALIACGGTRVKAPELAGRKPAPPKPAAAEPAPEVEPVKKPLTIAERWRGPMDAQTLGLPIPNTRLEAPSPIQALVDASADGSVIEIPPGEHAGSVLIHKRGHLTLRARPGTAWLVGQDNQSTVLVIHGSSGITIEGLGVLHRTSGWCTGDAVTVFASRGVTVRGCDISGSGVVGFEVTQSTDVVLEGSHVHHCTYGAVALDQVQDVRIEGNLFRENRQEETDEEGIALRDVRGTVEIVRNTFAGNLSAPINIFRRNSVPIDTYARVHIAENVFFKSRSPNTLESIVDHSTRRPDIFGPTMGAVEVVSNCFGKSRARKKLADHVSPGAREQGNKVAKMRLDASYAVKRPRACRGRGAPTVAWLGLSLDPVNAESVAAEVKELERKRPSKKKRRPAPKRDEKAVDINPFY